MKKLTFYLMTLAFALSFTACNKGDDNNNEDNDNDVGLVVDGVEWAATNVDDFQQFAARPDMYTKFYQWNRSKAWPASGAVTGWPTEQITDPSWTNNPCPPGWRLPTKDEWQALMNTTSEWAEVNTRGNAVSGRFYGPACKACTLPSNMTGCIFLPAVGGRYSRDDSSLDHRGLEGYYWTSVQQTNKDGYRLRFTPHTVGIGPHFKAVGFSIRCVK